MTIASAITALSPSIWYKLDGSTGSETNSGSQTNPATITGSIDQGVAGPEEGTFATRLFSGGQVLSGVMDLSTLVGQTLAMWISTDATGFTATIYPVLGIGDPANRLTRGPLLTENHTSIGSPAFGARYGANATPHQGTPQPQRFWHWIVATFASGTTNMKVYVDGVIGSPVTIATPSNPLATDRLLLKCDEPVVVAHMCWFGAVLSQTQIQSVSNELATWPYSLPINIQPITGGTGGGGLTEDQAAQLTNIENHTNDIPGLVDASTYIANTVNTINGKVDVVNAKLDHVLANWDGYTGVTLPILTGYINQIIESVTARFTQSAEDIAVGIGTLLSSPLSQFFSSQDLSGGRQCVRLDMDISFSAFYGIQLVITDYPDDWKFKTPDRAWSLRDLAVIHIVRGGTMIMRQGVHTPTHVISPLPESFPVGLGRLEAELQPADYHITVDWAEGVCGRVWGLVLP